MSCTAEQHVMLRTGFWQQGTCVREARVHAVAENDEHLVDELSSAALPLERNTRLLAHCVTFDGATEILASDYLRQLVIGDRETLLLHARRLTFGDELPCVVSCPACGERMDFQVHVDQLLLPYSPHTPSRGFEEEMQAAGVRYRVRFRLPTAADLQRVLRPSLQDPRQAIRALLDQCVECASLPDDADRQLPVSDLPDDLVAQLSQRFEILDPQAEISLHLECPLCRQPFVTVLDIGSYFFRELLAREEQRLHQVHQLALAYHWSEADILRMSPRKRRMYLDLIEEGSLE